MLIDEPQFRRVVSEALRTIARQVDAIDSDAFDARIGDGVFTVDFDGGGTFVLSQQVPVRELWLSAYSRAWHFRWDGEWTERDSGQPLQAVLTEIFTRRLGSAVRFSLSG